MADATSEQKDGRPRQEVASPRVWTQTSKAAQDASDNAASPVVMRGMMRQQDNGHKQGLGGRDRLHLVDGRVNAEANDVA